MSYSNRNYNAPKQGKYNVSGQFIPSGEYQSGNRAGDGQHYTGQHEQGLPQPRAVPSPSMPAPPPPPVFDMDMKMEGLSNMDCGDSKPEKKEPSKPAWMKFKLTGVKKIPNRERRRRQNENLRRLLTPKNALMVLNEMLPGELVSNQFKVEVAPPNAYYTAAHSTSFCADLTVDGNLYKGYGENKLSARNAAAEQAIRDLIIKRMARHGNADAASTSSNGDAGAEEESLPMIQLASFALHKLFTEWEYEGHKVPQLRPASAPAAEAAPAGPAAAPEAEPPAGKAKRPRVLPDNAAAMHPCMLLTYMRPRLEYRELAAEGDKPQNMVFTLGVDVDGDTYVGKASNKKEARKAAARAACEQLFGVAFDAIPTASEPQHAAAV